VRGVELTVKRKNIALKLRAMKKFSAREVVALTLPVVVLGGGAWWMGRGGKLPQLHNSLDPGPLRIEYTPFQPVQPSPYDVSQGYSWGVSTRVEMRGKWNPPKGWKQWGEFVCGGLEKVVYRRGKGWREAASVNRFNLVQTGSSSDAGTTVLVVNLQTVPRDAEEVRIRGRFRRDLDFTGPIPRAWKKPSHMTIFKSDRSLAVESKPFDIQIKGPNEPFPLPVVSHQSPLQIVDAKWVVEDGINNFVLQVHRTDGQGWVGHNVSADKVRVTDERGRPVDVGPRNSSGFGGFNQELFSPQRDSSDIFVPFLLPDSKHSESYDVPFSGPLHLQSQISDGTCWPLSVDVKVPRVDMKLADFGALK